MLGIKQDALAIDLGLSQQTISQIEQKEVIEKDMLEKIAAALKVPKEAVELFDEEKVIYNISCNFSDNAINNNGINFQTINPIEKWMDALEENKKLYERLLQAEREKVELMERMIKGNADL